MNLTKDKLIDLLMLLSAIESWSFATKEAFPDYLHHDLRDVIELLREGVLKGGEV